MKNKINSLIIIIVIIAAVIIAGVLLLTKNSAQQNNQIQNSQGITDIGATAKSSAQSE
jgi:hypothetical protein